MAPKEKPTGTPHSDDSDLDGCDQQKEKVGEGEEKLTTQEREKLRLKGNKKWSDYRLQIDRMVEKWVGFFPRARLLVAGVGPGRDFFFFPRGECKEFSRLQLRRMEAWLKSMMKSKEERELLLEAFDEARDKATLISQLKATNGSIHYQGGNNNRDELILRQFSDYLRREGFIAPVNERGFQKSIEHYIDAKISREQREIRVRRQKAKAILSQEARAQVLAGGDRRLRRSNVKAAEDRIREAMDPDERALLDGSDESDEDDNDRNEWTDTRGWGQGKKRHEQSNGQDDGSYEVRQNGFLDEFSQSRIRSALTHPTHKATFYT